MITLIAAIDSKRGIARDGHIPWKLPEDTKRYRALALKPGNNVLMGRKTYDAMGYLEGRKYFIVSHQGLDLPEGAHIVKDLPKFITNFKEDIWVVGGAAIYDETIKFADQLILTVIDEDFKCDKFFPDYSDFVLKTTDGPHTDNHLSYSYQLFGRH